MVKGVLPQRYATDVVKLDDNGIQLLAADISNIVNNWTGDRSVALHDIAVLLTSDTDDEVNRLVSCLGTHFVNLDGLVLSDCPRVVVSTIRKFKGLERRAVLVVHLKADVLIPLAYVATSRANCMLGLLAPQSARIAGKSGSK